MAFCGAGFRCPWYKVRDRVAVITIPDVVGNVSRTLTSSDLYEHGNGDFERRCVSLIVMKIATVSLVLSTALIVALACQAQTNSKKDSKTEDARTPTSSTATVTISKTAAFGSHLEPILKTVSATDDQRKSITAIVDEYKVRVTTLRKRHDELRDQFLKTLTSGESGETVLATQSEFIRAQADLHAQYLALRLKIQQVLTSEQNEKFKEYRLKQGWKTK